MTDYDDTYDTDIDTEASYAPATATIDRFGDAIALCNLAANAKSIGVALRKLRRMERDQVTIAQEVATMTAAAERREGELAQRSAELDQRESAIIEREIAFETSLAEARDELRAHYSDVAQADTQIRYRVLSLADLLHGYNPQLQELPSWQVIKQMIPALPSVDPPEPPAEIVSENVRHDWAGSEFIPNTALTRTINRAADR